MISVEKQWCHHIAGYVDDPQSIGWSLQSVLDRPDWKALMSRILCWFNEFLPKAEFETRSSGTGAIRGLSAFTLDSYKRSAGIDATLPGS
jgi:hypothetical protein